MARGLDFPDISLVVQFDLPATIDVYTHRIGRTGRVGQVGCALSYMGPKDKGLSEKLVDFLELNRQEVPAFLRPHGSGGGRYHTDGSQRPLPSASLGTQAGGLGCWATGRNHTAHSTQHESDRGSHSDENLVQSTNERTERFDLRRNHGRRRGPSPEEHRKDREGDSQSRRRRGEEVDRRDDMTAFDHQHEQQHWQQQQQLQHQQHLQHLQHPQQLQQRTALWGPSSTTGSGCGSSCPGPWGNSVEGSCGGSGAPFGGAVERHHGADGKGGWCGDWGKGWGCAGPGASYPGWGPVPSSGQGGSWCCAGSGDESRRGREEHAAVSSSVRDRNLPPMSKGGAGRHWESSHDAYTHAWGAGGKGGEGCGYPGCAGGWAWGCGGPGSGPCSGPGSGPGNSAGWCSGGSRGPSDHGATSQMEAAGARAEPHRSDDAAGCWSAKGDPWGPSYGPWSGGDRSAPPPPQPCAAWSGNGQAGHDSRGGGAGHHSGPRWW